jgi:hypothetical protein
MISSRRSLKIHSNLVAQTTNSDFIVFTIFNFDFQFSSPICAFITSFSFQVGEVRKRRARTKEQPRRN